MKTKRNKKIERFFFRYIKFVYLNEKLHGKFDKNIIQSIYIKRNKVLFSLANQ